MGIDMIIKNSKVKLNYIGRLDDGTIFDKSNDHPLEFVVGEGKVIPGFEEAVIGMQSGEKKTFTIPAEKAYGHRDETIIKEIEKSALPKDFKTEVGMLIKVHLRNGAVIPAKIVSVKDKEIVVDMNHPLAGKSLTFDITIVSIE
jgi:FKBP-type peptidyl-prolyl cis-trans isomerase 2